VAGDGDGALLVDRRGPVLVVTLNRPQRLNALDSELRHELGVLWGAVGADDAIHCVVLTGVGRGFCSGADVHELTGRNDAPEDVREELAFLPGHRLAVPVVAAVNGVCAGGGLHFVADADIVIASSSATFTDPHVSIGQVSGIEPSSLVPFVSPKVLGLLAYLGTGIRLDAATALAAGLVSEVVQADDLIGRALGVADAIAAASPAAVAETRRVLRGAIHRMIERGMEEGWQAVRDHWEHPDSIEGPRAFAERREPRWSATSAGGGR